MCSPPQSKIVLDASTHSSFSHSSTVRTPSKKVSTCSNTRDSSTGRVTTDNNEDDGLVIVSRQCTSTFRFYQVDERWQRKCCLKVGLQFSSTYQFPYSGADTVLLEPQRRYAVTVMGDGNCMFRSLSFSQHFAVRTLLCDHMYTIEQSILGHIAPHKTVEDYLQCTQINKNNVWGTDVQVRVFANLFNTNVYVYTHMNCELGAYFLLPLFLDTWMLALNQFTCCTRQLTSLTYYLVSQKLLMLITNH